MLSIWLEVAAEVKERRRANTAHRNLRPPSSTARQQSSVRPGCRDEPQRLASLSYFQYGAYIYILIYIYYTAV